MRKRTVALGVLGAVTAALVAGCTGSSGGSSNSAANSAQGKVSVGGAAMAGSAAARGAAPPSVKDDAAVTSTAEIRTAEMTVAVHGSSRVATQADEADAIAARAGGEVAGDDRTSGAHANAVLALRVPPDALQPTLRELAGLGTERSRHLSTTDVSQEVADVNSRVASARAAIDRLRALYGRAVKVSDVIALESELSRREADLESLEARQRTLTAQTSMAAITLTLVTAAPAAVHTKRQHRSGFVGGLENGWDGFTAAAAGVATGVGAALPFLAVLLLVAFGARVAWTRLPRRPRPSPESGPLPE